MTIKHGKGSRVFIAEFDFSGEGRSFEISAETDMAESTVFTSTAKEFVAGQTKNAVSHAGIWTNVDDNWDEWLKTNIFPALTKAISLLPGTPAVGDICYNGEIKEIRAGRPIRVDDICAINAEYIIDGPLGRANLLEYEIAAAVGAQTGIGQNIGVASATQMWLICIHVVEYNGGAGTYRIAIQESSDNGATDPYSTPAGASKDFSNAGGSFVFTVNGAREAWARVVTTQEAGTPTCKFLVTLAKVNLQ